MVLSDREWRIRGAPRTAQDALSPGHIPPGRQHLEPDRRVRNSKVVAAISNCFIASTARDATLTTCGGGSSLIGHAAGAQQMCMPSSPLLLPLLQLLPLLPLLLPLSLLPLLHADASAAMSKPQTCQARESAKGCERARESARECERA